MIVSADIDVEEDHVAVNVLFADQVFKILLCGDKSLRQAATGDFVPSIKGKVVNGDTGVTKTVGDLWAQETAIGANVDRNKHGLTPDAAANEKYLKDLDNIVAAKSNLTAWGITLSDVAYTAATIAWNGLHSPRTYSYWQLCIEAASCVVNLASGYTLGWEGTQPDPSKALELDLKAFDTGTKHRCAGAFAAHNIARAWPSTPSEPVPRDRLRAHG